MLSQADRIAFSLYEVEADVKIAGINRAKAQIQAEIVKAQALDTANANLFAAPNSLINQYQLEFQYLDSNVRTTILEQNIQDSANRTVQNFFFPNDVTVTVPALSATHNVWTRFPPFALTYALGLNYTQVFPSTTTKEQDLITPVTTLISSATGFFDIENTSGQHCATPSGTCSNILYTNMTDCVTNGGIWTPGVDTITSFPAVVTLKTNLVTAVNALVTFLNTEKAAIPTNDPNVTNQTENNAAIANINALLATISTWLGYSDFNPVPGSVTTCAAFYTYNPALLAPTKLNSAALAALQTALNNRTTYISTRNSQVTSILGTISQNLTDGTITSSSGLYGQRFGLLSLRLNLLTGSLIALNSLLNTTNAQTAIAQSIAQNKATYYSFLPTSLFQAPGNATTTISLVDVSFLNPGDVVYVISDKQPEITVAVKSINGNSVILTSPIPAQYTPDTNARLYKDLT